MPNPRVEPGALFYKKTRVGTIQGFDYTINTNDGQEIADSGAYNTDGRPTVEITGDFIVPQPGLGISVIADALNHQDMEITLGIVDGKIHTVTDARLKSGQFTSEIASGTQKGKLMWHAGKPQIVG